MKNRKQEEQTEVPKPPQQKKDEPIKQNGGAFGGFSMGAAKNQENQQKLGNSKGAFGGFKMGDQPQQKPGGFGSFKMAGSSQAAPGPQPPAAVSPSQLFVSCVKETAEKPIV